MIHSSSFVDVALGLIAGKQNREVWVPSKWHHVRIKFRWSQSTLAVFNMCRRTDSFVMSHVYAFGLEGKHGNKNLHVCCISFKA